MNEHPAALSIILSAGYLLTCWEQAGIVAAPFSSVAEKEGKKCSSSFKSPFPAPSGWLPVLTKYQVGREKRSGALFSSFTFPLLTGVKRTTFLLHTPLLPKRIGNEQEQCVLPSVCCSCSKGKEGVGCFSVPSQPIYLSFAASPLPSFCLKYFKQEPYQGEAAHGVLKTKGKCAAGVPLSPFLTLGHSLPSLLLLCWPASQTFPFPLRGN